MTASIIDPDREGTSGLPNDWHQNLTDTHRAQTAQTSDAPDSRRAQLTPKKAAFTQGTPSRHGDQRAVEQSCSRSRVPLGDSRSDTLP